MSILDPSIILAGGDISNPNKLLDLKLGMQKLQANAQTMQSQNALKQLLASPQAYSNGQLTPQAKQAVFAADPSLGLDIQKQDMNAQVLKAKQAASATEVGAKKFDMYSKLAGVGVNAYEDAKKAGKSEEDARGAAVAARNTAAQETYDSGSGILSEQDFNGLQSHKFDPAGATALASLDKDWSTNREKGKADDRADKRENRMENMEGARLGIEDKRLSMEDRRLSDAEDKAGDQSAKWEVLTDTKKDADGNPVQYRYNPATAKATTLTGDPYTPAGASKMGAAGASGMDKEHVDSVAKMIANYQMAPLSSQAMRTPYGAEVMSKVNELNPDYAATEFGSRSKATRDFSTGKQGQQINSFNVGIAHLGTMEKLTDALKNGDIKSINSLDNYFKEQFGSPAPTNFDAAKAIVGDEIIKAIVGGGGALADRENAQNQLSSAKTPEQLQGVIKTYKELMAGQLRGLGKQYQDTTGLKNFDSRLTPETKKELYGDDAPAAAGKSGASKSAAELPKVSDKASYSALKSGDRFLDPDGHERVKP